MVVLSTVSGAVVDRQAARRSTTNRAVFGAWLGFYVDLFDIYLPVIVLAPAAVYFQASGASAAHSAR
jgi:hypothetical protein